MIEAQGQEVLVIDGDPKVQRGIEHLLSGAGLLPTVLGEPMRALDLATEKFFAVALVDLDTPVEGGGLEVIELLRGRSPRTAVVAMASRRAFDVGVKAFRAGALDVIGKAPDQIDYLRTRVLALATTQRKDAAQVHLVEEAVALHEEMMKVLLDTWKRAMDLEQAQDGAGDDEEGVLDEVTSVLMVEDDGWLGGQLEPMLDERYEMEVVSTGGEALDLVAGEKRFQIALVKDALPDLPGSMVVRTIKQVSPETIVLLFTRPKRERPGAVQVIESARSIPFIPSFAQPRQLADRLDEIREAFRATTRERRYLGAFRQQHFDLLRRYAELKQKLGRAKEEG